MTGLLASKQALMVACPDQACCYQVWTTVLRDMKMIRISRAPHGRGFVCFSDTRNDVCRLSRKRIIQRARARPVSTSLPNNEGQFVGVSLLQEGRLCNYCSLTAMHTMTGRQDRTPISDACRTLCRDCRAGSASLRGRSARIGLQSRGTCLLYML